MSATLFFAISLCARASTYAQAPERRNTQVATGSIQDHRASPSSTANVTERELLRALALKKKLTQHDLQTAVWLFADSSRRFALVSDSAKAAYAGLEAGDTYQMLSRYRQALASYRRSLTFATDNLEARCSVLSHMARTYANMGLLSDAKKYAADAAANCADLSDKKTLSDVVEAQGEVSFWSSNMSDAIKSFSRARQLAIDNNDIDNQALSSMMLAQAINANDRDQSFRLAWAALRLWSGNDDAYGVARAHMTLAFLSGKEGNFRLAQCHCESALPVFQKVSDKDNAAIASNVLGMVARESGDLDASLMSYRSARDDFAAAHDDLGEAESLTGLAHILAAREDYDALQELCSRKFTIAKRTGNRALLASALMDQARVYAAQHRYAESEASLQKGLVEYRAAANRYGEGVALMLLVDLRLAQNNFEEALALSDQALVLKEETHEAEHLARIQYVRACINWKLHRIDDARAEIEKTIAIIESQRLRIDKFDSRAQYFASVHEYYSFYIHVLMALDELHPGQGYDRLAFEAAERSKVRALLDLLSDTHSSPPCEQLFAESSNPDQPQIAEPTLTTAVGAAKALTLAETQTQIADSNSVLVEYALGDEASYAWMVDAGTIRSFKLASAPEIRKTIRLVRTSLAPVRAAEEEAPDHYLRRSRAAKQAFAVQSRQLSRLLLGPLELPPEKRLLVVPDGALQYVPFALLQCGKDAAPLLERNEITMLPSASALAALRNSASAREPPIDSISVFADPVFENPLGIAVAPASRPTRVRSVRPNELQRALLDSQDSQQIPSLPGSRAEAIAIQEIFGQSRTHLSLNFDANRAAILGGSLARQRVIHFATHGIVDTAHPEMSGLILSLFNRKGETQDGYLRLSDIYRLKLSADLVVLSSCESALGKDLQSEGMIGLPRGFLYAGARSVIASLWKVDDNATAALMKALYSRLERGERPSEALRGAQLELVKGTRFSDPYYWGAFVLEGDYK